MTPPGPYTARACTVFALLLAVVFVVWYRRERTLSIRAIDTTNRESFHWLAVLFTFALGTAAGGLVSERMDLGYRLSAVLFALAIAAVAVAHFALGPNAVGSFRIAYILTRPLGASIGDHLSQPTGDGGALHPGDPGSTRCPQAVSCGSWWTVGGRWCGASQGSGAPRQWCRLDVR